jgi:hypothetical protein
MIFVLQPATNYLEHKLPFLNHLYRVGLKNTNIFHGLSKLGTVYFTHWGNGESLTYSDFPTGYNIGAFNAEHCGIFE